jgi:hypothetical protein
LMESVNSCIFLSIVLSCLTSSSSVFCLFTISFLSSEILSSACSSLLLWPSILICISVLFFFSEVFHIIGHFLFNIVNFHLSFNSISIYGVFCLTLVLLTAPMISFIYFLCFLKFFIFLVIEFLFFFFSLRNLLFNSSGEKKSKISVGRVPLFVVVVHLFTCAYIV